MQVRLGEKNGKKIPIYIDGEMKGSVYPKEINSYGLEDEGEISEAVYELLMKETLIPRAKRYVMNLLVKSDKTEAELRRKLAQSGYGDNVADTAIEYLRSFHYIDELRTAESFIRSKMDYSSEKEIRYKLSEKGINEETIDLAYDEIMESEETEDPELKAAIYFVRKRLGSMISSEGFLEDDISYEDKTKLMAAAFRKGFRQDSIKSALKRLRENA